jgi:hypothetical protein
MLKVFERKLHRRILGPKRDEVTGGCRKLCNEELNNLYTSSYIFRLKKARNMGLVGHVALLEEKRKVYRILMGKPKCRRSLRRRSCN